MSQTKSITVVASNWPEDPAHTRPARRRLRRAHKAPVEAPIEVVEETKDGPVARAYYGPGESWRS